MESQYRKENVLETLSQERKHWKYFTSFLKSQVYCMLTFINLKFKVFVISEREMFKITSSCESRG